MKRSFALQIFAQKLDQERSRSTMHAACFADILCCIGRKACVCQRGAVHRDANVSFASASLIDTSHTSCVFRVSWCLCYSLSYMAGQALGLLPANGRVATDGNVIKMLVQTNLGTTFMTKARPDVPVGVLPGVVLSLLHSIISSSLLLVLITYVSSWTSASVHFSYATLHKTLCRVQSFLHSSTSACTETTAMLLASRCSSPSKWMGCVWKTWPSSQTSS